MGDRKWFGLRGEPPPLGESSQASSAARSEKLYSTV